MQNVLAHAELGIKGDGGLIDEIGLHVDDVCAALPYDLFQGVDQARRDAAAPVRGREGLGGKRV